MNKIETNIGKCKLGNRIPKVAAIIDKITSLEEIRSLQSKGVDLFEIRFDLFKDSFSTVLSFVESLHIAKIPMLGTLRETELNSNNRISMFKELCNYVDAIDIELGSPISSQVLANAKNCRIVVSEHDFDKTPTTLELKAMLDRAVEQGAHIFKIAAMANSAEDVTRLLRFAEESTTPMIAISMGSIGTISRVIGPLFGSLFTYAFVGESVAPGQLSIEDITREIKMFYPR